MAQSKPRHAWLTPDSEEALADLLCRRFFVPDTDAFRESVSGALLELTYPWNWEQYGTMTPEETALVMLEMYNRYALDRACDQIAPYWDDEAASDAEGDPEEGEGYPWYGEVTFDEGGFPSYAGVHLEDWLIGAFIAIVAGDKKAIRFITSARQFKLAFRSGDYGAAVKVFIDGILYTLIDTYSSAPGVLELPVVVPALPMGGMGAAETTHELLIVLSQEDNNPAVVGTPQMQVIRKRLSEDEISMFELRQNPENSCQMQQSTDGGETWTLAFDYSICVPPSIETILEATLRNNTYVSPFQPSVTFITQIGYTDDQTEKAYQALCFAATFVVDMMCDAAYQQRTAGIDGANLIAAALELATAIAAGIAAALTIPVLGLVALAGAIAAAVVWLAGAIAATGADIWIDADNRAALACLMLQNLGNSPVTLAAFQTAFDHADCLTADQQTMAGILSQMLSYPAQEAQMFSAFLANVAEVNSQAQSDALDAACTCDTATWAYYQDICESVRYGDLLSGTQTSTGVQMNPATYIGWPSSVIIDWKFYLPEGATIDSAIMFIESGNTDNNKEVLVHLDGTEICNTTNPATNNPSCVSLSVSPGTHTVRFSYVWNANGGTGKLQGIGFTGTGVNPFSSNCDNNNPVCWTP